MRKLLFFVCAMLSLSGMAQKVNDAVVFDIKTDDVVKITNTTQDINNQAFSFDSNGALVAAKNGDEDYQITELVRNDDGNLTYLGLSNPMAYEYTEFYWSNGRLVGYGNDFEYNSFVYDDDGNIVTIDSQAGKKHFSNYVFDEKGNWISRDVTTDNEEYTETRTLEYADGTVTSTNAATNYKKTSKSMPLNEILITIAILVAMLWITVHTLYVTFVEEKTIGPITVDEMKNARAAVGKPSESAEDNEKAWDVMHHIYTDDLTPDPNEPDQMVPTTYAQVKDYRKSLAQMRELMPTDADIIDAYNNAAEALNECQKRVFDGSKAFIGICAVLTIAIAYLSDQWGMLIMLIPVLIYFLATRKPVFIILGRLMKGKKVGGGFIASILGGAAAGIATARTITTVYKWSDGTTTKESDNSEHGAAWIVAILFFIIVCVVLPLIVVVNYLRNYVFYK